ncbi:hypothetical protein [Cryobacterium gelidum]|uniref:hypothetical protein n=1 Tax=Cryobacterium gelidum TaxID=1259164 RepID=UPI003B96CDAB
MDIDETLIPELRKLTKEVFDLDSIINSAEELKHIGQIKRTIAAQFTEPEDDWIRFFTTRVYEGAFTQKVREQFTSLVTKSTKQFLNDQVNDRLKTALGGSNFSGAAAESAGNVINSHDIVEGDLARETEIETRHPIDSLDEIYLFADGIRETI